MDHSFISQGWAGLYKGMSASVLSHIHVDYINRYFMAVPSIIHNLIATVTTVPVLVAFRFILPQPSVVYPSMSPVGRSSPPNPSRVVGLAISLIPVVLLVPMLIITNRFVCLSLLRTQRFIPILVL
jgi:hypothetical protein